MNFKKEKSEKNAKVKTKQCLKHKMIIKKTNISGRFRVASVNSKTIWDES